MKLLPTSADTLIRKRLAIKKSLNDFEHIAASPGGNTGPLIVLYRLPEIVADLNQVMACIRRGCSAASSGSTRAPILRASSRADPSLIRGQAGQGEDHVGFGGSRRGASIDVWYSIGIRVMADGTVLNVPLG